MTDPVAAIIAYREALDALRASDPADAAAGTLRVLLARDAVAEASSRTTTSDLKSQRASWPDSRISSASSAS